MRKLLVFIPTYNRHELVLRQLDLLSSQIKNRENVRVVVSDNSNYSNDSIELNDFCNSHKGFKYNRNFGNIGANANFLLGFSQAKQDEVLWILADDTVVKPGAIDFILEKLDPEVEFYGFATANDFELLRLPNQNGGHLDKTIIWEETGIYKLVSNTSWGGITCALYDMNYFKDFVISGFEFHNSSFPHLAILFAAYKKNSTLRIRLLPLEIIHGENTEAGDYSLSVAGMPQLFSFAPDWERRKITISWLKRYSAAFYFSRRTHPEIFEMTRHIVKSYGGVQGFFWLALGKTEYLIRNTKPGLKVQSLIQGNERLARLFRRTGRTLMLGD